MVIVVVVEVVVVMVVGRLTLTKDTCRTEEGKLMILPPLGVGWRAGCPCAPSSGPDAAGLCVGRVGVGGDGVGVVTSVGVLGRAEEVRDERTLSAD